MLCTTAHRERAGSMYPEKIEMDHRGHPSLSTSQWETSCSPSWDGHGVFWSGVLPQITAIAKLWFGFSRPFASQRKLLPSMEGNIMKINYAVAAVLAIVIGFSVVSRATDKADSSSTVSKVQTLQNARMLAIDAAAQ